MRKLKNDELKLISLEILKNFNRVCVNNKISYSLGYGTLLGAVRHKGFIPWDDDIDVIMLREEYEKLFKVREQLGENFLLVSVDTDKKYTTPLPKIIDRRTKLIEYEHRDNFQLGVYIDIFVFDYCFSNKFKNYIYKIRSLIARKVWGLATYKPKSDFVIELLLRNIALRFNLGRKASIILDFFNKRNPSTFLVGNLQYSVYGLDKDTFLYSDFLNVENIKFENLEVKAVKNRNYFLEKWYGDFMKLPPIDKRISHHNFKAYYK